MIITSRDNTVVFGLLEQSDNLFADFSMDKTILFEHEEDCWLVFYIAETRNFISFAAKDHLQDVNAMPELLSMIQGGDLPENRIEEATRLIEDKMHSSDNYRFYFDAH